MQLEILSQQLQQKYSSDDIRAIIRKAFDKQGLKKIPFEFAISPLSLIGEEVQSENFYNLFIDSVNNRMQVIQLESPEESLSEGISPQEVLMIIVPHAKKLIWRSHDLVHNWRSGFYDNYHYCIFSDSKSTAKTKKAERNQI
jgi:hypothetical protein